MNIELVGKIMSKKDTFGFIESPDFHTSYYFHHSEINSQVDLKINDYVIFKLRNGKRDKLEAYDIRLTTPPANLVIEKSIDNLNNSQKVTKNHELNRDSINTKTEYITLKFGEHKGRKLRYVKDHFPEYIEECINKNNHWILEGKESESNKEVIEETKVLEEDMEAKELADNLIITNVGEEKVNESKKIKKKYNTYLKREEIQQIQEHYFQMPFSAFDLFKKLIIAKNIKIKNSELRSYFDEIINKELA